MTTELIPGTGCYGHTHYEGCGCTSQSLCCGCPPPRYLHHTGKHSMVPPTEEATQKAFLKARELGTQEGATDDNSDQYILTELEIMEVLQMHAALLSATEEAAFKAGLETERVYAGEGGWEWFHKPTGRIAKTAEGALEIYRQSKAGSVK